MLRKALRPITRSIRSIIGTNGLADGIANLETLVHQMAAEREARAENNIVPPAAAPHELDSQGSMGNSASITPHPAETPISAEPLSPLRVGTLSDLDALNKEFEFRSIRDRIRAVGEFVLDVRESPLFEAGDPFSQDYYDRALQSWRMISGRAEYDPQRDELAPYLDPKTSLLSPAFYISDESLYVGENLSAMGFLLQKLNLHSGDSVLEYGAGDGQISLHLARMRCRVSIIDIEQRYLDGIKLQADAVGAEIALQQGVFGDGFADSRKFDRILFVAAFHHSLDHAAVLRRLHDHLAPGGKLFFAAEPVIKLDGPWTQAVPFAWGPRLDGLSVNAMRIHGWCELGFREDYFIELLLRSGYTCEYHPCPATPQGDTYIAQPHNNNLNMGDPFLILTSGRDAGWHAPESGLRWTKGHALLPLDRKAPGNGIAVSFYNFLPIEKTVTVRLDTVEQTLLFAPGEEREVCLEVPETTAHLEIISSVDALAPYTGAHDTRLAGIAVRTVKYLPA